MSINDTVKHARDGRTGSVVQIKDSQSRARVLWLKPDGTKDKRTWVRLSDLLPIRL